MSYGEISCYGDADPTNIIWLQLGNRLNMSNIALLFRKPGCISNLSSLLSFFLSLSLYIYIYIGHSTINVLAIQSSAGSCTFVFKKIRRDIFLYLG